ncbi:uncharacterized protein LOC131168670 isoform X3 [Malania oleifera]|uniref:uncharacterized protein LOC131168670 isoform X3 n=1 Tax=Malania oleifera TaxID=397392 RepID=UPI0025AEC9E6|nr:uncharacterized protein LOC131168670 isoform X3 [Malania oleifera]
MLCPLMANFFRDFIQFVDDQLDSEANGEDFPDQGRYGGEDYEYEEEEEEDEEEEEEHEETQDESFPDDGSPEVSETRPWLIVPAEAVSRRDSESAVEEEVESGERREERAAAASTSTSNRGVSREGCAGGECSQGEIDGLFCPICMQAWTSEGEHHICCLPCGHIYGMSCIKKWLEQCRSSGKCPQCNRKCMLKDIRKLYASRIIVVDEESQQRAGWHDKEAEWHNKEAALCQKVCQLTERTTCLERLLGEAQSRPSEFFNSSQGRTVSGHKLGSSMCTQGSPCSFVLQEELQVDGARIFDVDASGKILIIARRLSGMGGTYSLTKMSLMNPQDSENILLSSYTKAVRDLRVSPHGGLALLASLGKKLSILSMESNNIILTYDLPDQNLGAMIGSARMIDGLYYFDDTLVSNKQAQGLSGSTSSVPAAAWSCAWDYNSSHHVYAGLQNGMLLVFDMRQTAGPVESMSGLTCNPVHTIHSLLDDTNLAAGVRTLLSASSVGLCQWSFGNAERGPFLVPQSENQGVCISLAYCPRNDDIVASFRPKVGMLNEVAVSQPLPTPTVAGQGVQGSHVLFKRRPGLCSYDKLGSSSAMVSDIRLPKSAIIDAGDRSSLFASADEVSCELILQDLPSFGVTQCLKSHSYPFRDVKFSHAFDPGLLGCLTEDKLQLFSAKV